MRVALLCNFHSSTILGVGTTEDDISSQFEKQKGILCRRSPTEKTFKKRKVWNQGNSVKSRGDKNHHQWRGTNPRLHTGRKFAEKGEDAAVLVRRRPRGVARAHGSECGRTVVEW